MRSARKWAKAGDIRVAMLARARHEIGLLLHGLLPPAFPYPRRAAAVAHHHYIESLESCWRQAWVCPGGHFAVAGSSCHHILCPFCSRSHAARQAAKYLPTIDLNKKYVHWVLTLPRCPFGALRDWVRRIVKSFGEMRRSDIWNHVKGCIWHLEAEPKSDGYHLHLHVLVDGRVDNRKDKGFPLEVAWARCTRWADQKPEHVGKRVVWYTLKRGEQALHETLKYVCKMPCGGDTPPDWDAHHSGGDRPEWPADYPALAEMLLAFHGRKTCDCTGCFRDELLKQASQGGGPKPAPEDDDVYVPGDPCPTCGAATRPVAWRDLIRGRIPWSLIERVRYVRKFGWPEPSRGG